MSVDESAKALEALAEINKKCDVLNSRLGAVEANVSKVDEFLRMIDELNEKIKEHDEKQEVQKNFYYSSLDKFERKLEEFFKKVNFLEGKFAEYELQFKKLKAFDEAHEKNSYEFVQKVMGNFKEIKSDYCLKSDFLSFNEKIENKFQKLSAGCDKLKEDLNIHVIHFKEHKDLFKNHEMKYDVEYEFFRSIIHAFRNNQMVLEDKFKTIPDELHGKMNELKKSFDEKLVQIKEEKHLSPDQLDKFEKSVNKKMELVALDASNASLKVNNIDHLYRVLERKFENLQQIVKKFELNK